MTLLSDDIEPFTYYSVMFSPRRPGLAHKWKCFHHSVFICFRFLCLDYTSATFQMSPFSTISNTRPKRMRSAPLTCSGYYQRKSFGFSPEEPDASRQRITISGSSPLIPPLLICVCPKCFARPIDQQANQS